MMPTASRGDVEVTGLRATHSQYASGIALIDHQGYQDGRNRSRKFELRISTFWKRHRTTHIDHYECPEISGLSELARVEAVGPSKYLPVHVLQVVTWSIVTILTKLGVETMKRAAMQALPEALDRRARQQLQVAQRRQF
jgi:hypothetical protein